MDCVQTSSTNFPLVSVVVATFRQEETLRKALRSLLAQSYPRLEILVIDDNCCPEWNQKVCGVLSALGNPSCIRYLQNKKNLGSAGTRNAGIFAAKGDYITFLDDDDLYLPDKIKHQVCAMLESGADFSISNLDNYYDDGTACNFTRRTYLKNAGQTDLLRLHFMYHMTCPDTMMFHTPYLQKLGGFGTLDLGDEFYLMSDAILAGGRFCYVPCSDVQTFVHRRETGLSSGCNKLEGERQLYEYKKKFFPAFDLKSRRCIRMRHHMIYAYAYERMKNPFLFLFQVFLGFFSSPTAFFRLFADKKCSGRNRNQQG